MIEHNLEVIKTADWMIDLGPEGGDGGGRIVAEGTPEAVARAKESYTGAYLKELLARRGGAREGEGGGVGDWADAWDHLLDGYKFQHLRAEILELSKATGLEVARNEWKLVSVAVLRYTVT